MKNIKTNTKIESTIPEKIDIGTSNEITWCPGCPDFLLLAAIKNVLTKLIKEGYNQNDFAMATGIGCNQKIYDYINISGIYGLHGRVLPICLGMKLGNPNLKILGFAGDGCAYAEGIEHLVHSARFNFDMTYLIANNQNFALTTGQPTPTSQQGYKSKAEPLGEFNKPLNPIKVALASNASFVARVNPKDIKFTEEILEKAIKHNGFALVESLQDCMIFNTEMIGKDKSTYKIQDNHDWLKAMEIADEWDYNSKDGKIAVGVIFSKERPTLEDEWPQLKKLKELKKSWKDIK